MSEITVRERIHAIQRDVRDGALSPEGKRSALLTLTALLGNISDEIIEADSQYAAVLLETLEADGPANRAKIRAECSPEYRRRQTARALQVLATEMIRSLKRVMQSEDEEMRLSR